MITILVAMAAGTLAAAPDPGACATWGPALNGGLTTVKRCLDQGGQAVAPWILTRENVASFASGRWAGLVIDASTLQLTPGPVPEGGELLRIKVRQGYAARLTTRFVGRGMGGASLQPGDLVYGASMRQSITTQRPGQAAYETSLSGMVYLYCAPVRLKPEAPTIDRGMCFIDTRENNKIGLFPGIKMNLDSQYTLVLSGKGEAAHAPASLEMAATMGVRKPKVEAFDGPYPDAFDLVVTWTQRNGRRMLQARAVDPAGVSSIADVLIGDRGAMVFGGQLRLEPAPTGLAASFETPVIDGAIVNFHVDQATH